MRESASPGDFLICEVGTSQVFLGLHQPVLFDEFRCAEVGQNAQGTVQVGQWHAHFSASSLALRVFVSYITRMAVSKMIEPLGRTSWLTGTFRVQPSSFVTRFSFNTEMYISFSAMGRIK